MIDNEGMILLLTFLLLSLSVTACELHTRKGELMSVMPSGTNSETINKVEDVDDKLQGMSSTSNVITEVRQVILDYYAAYIEIYKGADIHIMYIAFQKGTQTAPHGGTVPPQAGM